MTADFEKSKFYKYGKFLREVVEMGEPISDKDLDNMLEVIQEIRNFALGYSDKVLLVWSSMAALPLESYKFHRSFNYSKRKKKESDFPSAFDRKFEKMKKALDEVFGRNTPRSLNASNEEIRNLIQILENEE